MRLDQTSDLWWKNAVIYCLDVETYLDGDGDGVGDFGGLIRQVDYLAGLGGTCLWLMPFYPSPGRDDGYDIADYFGVDPRLGSLGEFVDFVRTAADRGIRVIVDLVLNHTSDEHPWFEEARASKDSPKRSFYIWRDEPSDEPKGIAFPDQETSNWEKDPGSGQYYLHRFYRFQPDLNMANPKVRDEIAKIVGFWLQLGVAGFRMDAVPFMLELDGIAEQVDGDPHEWLRSLRAFAARRKGDTVLLGEVNAALKDLARFFGDEDGDQLNMQFAFLLNQNLWLSLAREDAEPLEATIRSLPDPPPENSWATFLRNHDELSLDKLTAPQREEVFAAFGPDAGMQLYGHGLRRRAASMLGDGPRLRMAWSLMLSLPGTPVIFMGDEIGMGENLVIPDRMSVRVPMRVRHRQRRLLHRLRGCAGAPARGRDVRPAQGQCGRATARSRLAVELDGAADPSAKGDPRVRLGHERADRDGRAGCVRPPLRVAGLYRGGCAQPVGQRAAHDAGSRSTKGERVEIDDLLEERRHQAGRDGTLEVELDAYGYLWLRLRHQGERPLS